MNVVRVYAILNFLSTLQLDPWTWSLSGGNEKVEKNLYLNKIMISSHQTHTPTHRD